MAYVRIGVPATETYALQCRTEEEMAAPPKMERVFVEFGLIAFTFEEWKEDECLRGQKINLPQVRIEFV